MWVPGRSSRLNTYVCFNSITIFRNTRCVWHSTNTIPFRSSADPVVSTFAIHWLNDKFCRKFLQRCFGSVMLFLYENCDQTQDNFVENHIVVC